MKTETLVEYDKHHWVNLYTGEIISKYVEIKKIIQCKK